MNRFNRNELINVLTYRCHGGEVVEEIPPFYVKHFEYPEKHYINVTHYYNYYGMVANKSSQRQINKENNLLIQKYSEKY